jgi:hypothetical protein
VDKSDGSIDADAGKNGPLPEIALLYDLSGFGVTALRGTCLMFKLF